MNTEKKEYQGFSPTQPDLWIDKKMDQLVKSKGGRIFAGLTALTVATIVAACTNAQPTNIPPETAPAPGETATATTVATEQSGVPTPERPNGSGGLYLTTQLEIINRDDFVEQEYTLIRFMEYWGNATGITPIYPGTTDVTFIYMFDRENPASAGVCLEAKGYDNVCLTTPVFEGKFVTDPRAVILDYPEPDSNYSVLEGMGPLMMRMDMDEAMVAQLNLSADCIGSKLGWSEGRWVRYSADGTKIVARLNTYRGGIWMSTEYTEKYPAAKSTKYTGTINGIGMPIDWGLSQEIMTRANEPITDLQLSTDGPDLLADDLMHMFYLRYTQHMGHLEVTFEEYIKLVGQGLGNVEFMAHDSSQFGGAPRIMEVDSSKGTSIVFEENRLPTNVDGQNSVYYAVDQGRLLMVVQLSASLIDRMEEVYPDPDELVLVNDVEEMLRLSFGFFAAAENKCLDRDDYLKSCGLFKPDVNIINKYDRIFEEDQKFFQGKRGPVFIVKQ